MGGAVVAMLGNSLFRQHEMARSLARRLDRSSSYQFEKLVEDMAVMKAERL